MRLRDMKFNYAVTHCVNITADEWSTLDDGEQMDLLTVIRSFILNGYVDDHIGIPDRIANVWARCKAIIDREVAK